MDDHAAAAALELALAGQPAAPALAAVVERARRTAADERSALATARLAAVEAVAATETEIEGLAAAHDDGPRPPFWTRADRADRDGAPLWRLIDFNDGVPAERRCGLEAALEAAGLLDAWVTPSGRLEDPTLADVVLAGDQPAADASLLQGLAPVSDQAVGEAVVTELLRSIGLGEHDTGPWVDFDGRFQLGPLAGRGSKDRAEHIGAAAREARRAARIAELRDRIASLAAEIEAHDAGIVEVDRRRATLDAELDALPPVDAITSAVDAVRVASALEADVVRAHEQASVAARMAADAEIAADAARREHAAAHGLSAPLDEAALDGLSDAAAELPGAAAAVGSAWELADREAQAATTFAARLSEAQRAAGEQDHRAQDEQAESDRLSTEHAAREEALGATGEELRHRHAEVVSALRAIKATHRHAATRHNTRRSRSPGSNGTLTSANASTRPRAPGVRRQASPSGSWREPGSCRWCSATPCPSTLSGPPAGASPVRSRSHARFRRSCSRCAALRASSASRSSAASSCSIGSWRRPTWALMQPEATTNCCSCTSPKVVASSRSQQILDTLSAEIADREQILTVEERRVFSEALVEEIADHLRHRIHEVRGRVEQMNKVLERSPTAAGKRVQLEWQPLDDDQNTQRAALTLLRRDVRHLGEDGRGDLVAFFRGRIETARREHGSAGEPKPMADTLMDAFDYRKWFAFRLHEQTDAGRIRLTKRRHAVGSGGEQSVLIHLPLFAAAAALYGDTQAPRLIMLDEALSGIDDETRERVLEATVAFDLDLVMTSHELWGTYRSVPQLAIYQLHRENGAFGVHAIPFIWDGDVLRELEQAELLV